MANGHGAPIWYELVSDDPGAAERFYGPILGWRFSRPPGGLDRDYRVFEAADGTAIGGLMRRPDGMAMPPAWLFYVAVDDVDDAAKRIAAAGGEVHLGPMDIPDVGRFAFASDPEGAPFYVMRASRDEPSRAFGMADGHGSWNELVTADQGASLRFYGDLFGWRKGDAMPMGAAGDYTFLHRGEPMVGAMMDRTADDRRSAWRFYFHVPDIDRAAREAEAGGGRIVHPPMEIPGGEYASQIDDPEGARVGFVGPRLAA
ncbi:VOC family protein [Aureimonas leprariae]|uniref:VOC family protein n=1 Tax=Plantimonas leprariae TaxID=2615207 RepID=A0A7V7PRM7_9HYPH|nr:VOC family protein [Aureimonas leprariae]KAB0681469.1 VOC family protein [Aureimonas leprariae]